MSSGLLDNRIEISCACGAKFSGTIWTTSAHDQFREDHKACSARNSAAADLARTLGCLLDEIHGTPIATDLSALEQYERTQ